MYYVNLKLLNFEVKPFKFKLMMYPCTDIR